MRPLGVSGIAFLIAILVVRVTGEGDVDLDCKPKPGCMISKCDPIPITTGSVFNLEESLKRSEYPITCEAKTTPLVTALVEAIGNRDPPPGQKGQKGSMGDAGPRGPTGPKSEVGKPGEKGGKGARGVAGRDGKNGIRGPVGTGGPKGSRGIVGPGGPKGSRGIVGPGGPKGSRGIVGPAGTSGSTGRPGIKGERGTPGPPGSPCNCASQSSAGSTPVSTRSRRLPPPDIGYPRRRSYDLDGLPLS